MVWGAHVPRRNESGNLPHCGELAGAGLLGWEGAVAIAEEYPYLVGGVVRYDEVEIAVLIYVSYRPQHRGIARLPKDHGRNGLVSIHRERDHAETSSDDGTRCRFKFAFRPARCDPRVASTSVGTKLIVAPVTTRRSTRADLPGSTECATVTATENVPIRDPFLATSISHTPSGRLASLEHDHLQPGMRQRY